MSIISASRTDIPAFYSEWFAERIKEEYLMVRNPYNPNMVSKISLSPKVVDCIVLWTKNPKIMLENGTFDIIKESGIPYYFQYTITGYESDFETFKEENSIGELIKTFKKLYELGNGHIIWRYDPIIVTRKYNYNKHISIFKYIAEQLKGYTNRCVISFVNVYGKVIDNMKDVIQLPRTEEENICFLTKISNIAKENGMNVFTCAEAMNLDTLGIKHSKCIDDEYIQSIIGKELNVKRDKGQRRYCGCIESIEVGTYGSCKNGCKYCYACSGMAQSELLYEKYIQNIHSPLLCDELKETDKIYEKEMSSFIIENINNEYEQLSLW